MIGDDVEVVVVEVKGDQIKLGVKAPRSLSILRTEVHSGIKDENKQAAASVPKSLTDLSKLLKKNKE